MSDLRLLAVIEASVITGPAKNLLEFARLARRLPDPVVVEVVTFERPGAPDLFRRACAAQGTKLHVIPETGRFDRRAGRDLAALVRSEAPDIVQTHAVKSHFLFRSTKLDRLFPWVAFHHGYTWTDWKMRAYNLLDRWSLPAAAAVATVSRPFAEELIRQGVTEEKITVFHNAIAPDWGAEWRDAERAAALRAELRIPAASPVLLIVGRLSKEKDHIALLEAMAAFPEGSRSTSAHLVVVGDGPERERILAAAARLRLDERIHLTGHVPGAGRYYGIADVAVLSSRTEGSPNALLEAMATRVPVVATRVGGIPEIVDDGAEALLVEAGDVPALSRAIVRILEDSTEGRRLGDAAARRLLMYHTPEERTRKLAAFYRAVKGSEASSAGRT